MLEKQIQFKAFNEQGQLVIQPLFIERGLEKTAEVLEMRSKLHPKIQDFVRTVRPTSSGIYVLVNALGAGEYWGSNVNGDLFPEKALIHSPPDWEKILTNPDQAREVGKSWPYGYPTFMGAYPYKHHVNKDPSRAFGRVELSTWNPRMHRVELVVYLDRALCMQFDALDIIERIENGEFPDVSMGCKVPYDICTICENPSKTRHDYCQHALTMMNKILPDGRKVAVRNDYPKFFDISFVFIGADKTAKVMAKLAQQGNQVCMGDFCTLPHLSAEVGEVFTKEATTRIELLGAGSLIPVMKEKKADPIDELPSNFGYSKEKAQAEKEYGDRIAGLQKFKQSPIQANQDKYAYPTLGAYLKDKIANDPVKKKIKIQGIPIFLEWLKGEVRQYKKGNVVKYKRLMQEDYGYIPGTMDSDGEELDVYVGPNKEAKNAYVIRQLKKTGGFDEHKVMIGFGTKGAAKASYLYHMGGTVEHFGGIQAIPVNSLVTLFGDNKAIKEKTACSCYGIGHDCGGSTDKLATLLFPISKSASHAKLSEIIKSLPAGPFTKETLPRLEAAEKSIPNDILDMMGNMPLSSALSTPTMAGMVLKPHEFQRIMLISIGERPMADELDNKGTTFENTKHVDDSLQIDENTVNHGLLDILRGLGIIKERSAAAPALSARSTSASANKPFHALGNEKTASNPLMNKLSATYNGYRYNLLKKAASISTFLTTDPQLRSTLFGSSMAQAFAGGIDKVAASAFSPDSLAYLVGAYTDRNMPVTTEVAAFLAQTGAISEAA